MLFMLKRSMESETKETSYTEACFYLPFKTLLWFYNFNDDNHTFLLKLILSDALFSGTHTY